MLINWKNFLLVYTLFAIALGSIRHLAKIRRCLGRFLIHGKFHLKRICTTAIARHCFLYANIDTLFSRISRPLFFEFLV